MVKPIPPDSLPCPLCDGIHAVRSRCYLARVTLTGTQEWAYKCADCATWWVIRWHPSQPAQYLIVDQRRVKPDQTALALEVQRLMGL